MPGENIQDWSTTATNNSNSDSSIGWAEGQTRASVNNSARAMMAAHAKDRNLKNGSIVTSGTVNAQTFFSGLDYTSVPTNLRVTLKIGPDLTNTAAATLNMDNIGAVAIKNQLGLDVAPGALVAGGYSELVYNGTNWVLITAAPGTLENIRVFIASGTYPTTTANCKVLVYAKGGGGGGGSSNDTRSGGGGGEGAESWKLTTAAALSGQTVTVGAGGAGAAAGAYGGLAGTTSIGTIITAPGGGAGVPGHLGGAGGAGGAGGTNDWGMPGAYGHTGGDNTIGTVGFFAPGGGKGGGGVANSGGGSSGSQSLAVTSAGGSGIIVCTEYGVI